MANTKCSRELQSQGSEQDERRRTQDCRPTHLDLFSGIGGFALAAQWAGFKTIGFCEIDKYCQKVLAKNFLPNSAINGRYRSEVEGSVTTSIRNSAEGTPIYRNIEGCCGSWPFTVRCFSNIFDLDGRQFAGVSLITGGFPCQPFSVAGKRRGAADDRAIWPEMFRVISEARPAWVLGENVPGIITMELDNVLSDLEGIGYATRSFVIPACAVDARHRRDRLWIVGRLLENSGSNGKSRRTTRPKSLEREQPSCSIKRSGCLPDTDQIHAQGCNNESTQNWTEQGERPAGLQDCGNGRTAIWLPEPNVGGTFDGLSRWLDGFGGLNGASKVEFASEAVCPLWNRVLSQELREPACISPEKILLALVCKLKKWNVDEAWIQLAGEEASKAELRGVRYNEASSCPSCRSGHNKQHVREHPDFVQVVSRLLARHAEKAWTEYRRSDASHLLGWETGYARVASGTSKRVDRLKGLGNAIVPQVAYEILREIRKMIL